MFSLPDGHVTDAELDAADMKYSAVWKAQLTPKFALEDYGSTCLAAAIVITASSAYFGVMRWGDRHRLVTPASLRAVQVWGGAAAVLSGVAMWFWFLVGMERQEFPSWSDSPGIAMCGGVGNAMVLLWIVALMPMAGRRWYRPRAEVLAIFRWRTAPRWPWWLIFGLPLGLCLFALMRAAAIGDFLGFVPLSLWVLFFGFLLAGQQRPAASVE